MRIDAHQHYWTLDRGDYGWITPEIPELFRDFLPADLKPLLRKHRLDGTIVVQAAPTWEESEHLFSLADTEESILGVVAWLDLEDPSHWRHNERFRQHPKFAGFRIMIQEMPDASRILAPPFVDALRRYAAEDVPVDLLIVSHQLDSLARLLDLVPGLRGVIDHIGKPRIAAGEREPWLTRMRQIAAHPNISCKLSGLVTEADHARWQPGDLTVYIRDVCELFGPQRVMFGSDWPVCLLAASYDQVMEALLQALPVGWGERERSRLFGENAKEFYKR